MYTELSSAAADVLLSGGIAVGRAEVWSLAGVRKARLSVAAGSCTWDRTAAIPRSCDVTLAGFEGILPDLGSLPPAKTYADTNGTYADDVVNGPYGGDLVNRQLRGLLIPAVTELRLFLDVWLPDGSVESIPMGHYRIATVNPEHTPKGVRVHLTGFDVARSVRLAGYTTPYAITAGTNTRAALLGLLSSKVPGVTATAPSTEFTAPRLCFLPSEGADPWADCRTLAWSAGWDLLTTRTGGIVAVVPGDPGSGEPVWSLTEATLTRAASTVDDEECINTVVCFGQTAEDVPVRGVAQQTAGQWGTESVGTRTKFFTVPTVRTEQQAQNTAQGLLRQLMGLTDTIELDVPMAPHLDPGDLVAVDESVLQLEDTVYCLERSVFDFARQPTRLTLSRRLA
ncbi:hypothetical protein [Modestobacter sp. KNN46-3]|uniref:hypothetical protein n=1 Tax=Modestobacter sp. KNN46-3 TaxID=2711218 RepID=UPI0013E0E126|nr:hypothetical protein [Modestobacter sp. KNN46-3]